MNESKVEVSVGGRNCVVTYSNLESIICNTTSASNTTVASKVNIETYNVDISTVASEWLGLAEVVSAFLFLRLLLYLRVFSECPFFDRIPR